MPLRTASFATSLATRRPFGPSGGGGASSVLRLGLGAIAHAAPQSLSRPLVLARASAGSLQLSLFGPAGERR